MSDEEVVVFVVVVGVVIGVLAHNIMWHIRKIFSQSSNSNLNLTHSSSPPPILPLTFYQRYFFVNSLLPCLPLKRRNSSSSSITFIFQPLHIKFPSYSVFFGNLFLSCANSSKYLLTNVLRSFNMEFSSERVVEREGTTGSDSGFDVEFEARFGKRVS